MPASLKEIQQADGSNFRWTGESYSRNIRIPKRNNNLVEGFSEGNPGFPNGLVSRPYHQDAPEALWSSDKFSQLFHPIDDSGESIIQSPGYMTPDFEQQLSYDTSRVLCTDALSHYRKCGVCRRQVLAELQKDTSSDTTTEGFANFRRRDQMDNNFADLLSLAGAGIFTIFLIDAFTRLGAKLN